MKAADAKAPKFDSKWWKLNKAKDADPKGVFEKALSDYEDAKKAFAKNPPDLLDVHKKLASVVKAAKETKADPKLGVMQKDTKDGLASYEKLATASQARLAALAKDPDFVACTNKDVSAILTDLVKRQSKPLMQHLAKEHSEENLEFMILLQKKVWTKKVYDLYVASSGAKQVNLGAPTQKGFDDLAAKGADANWELAPWRAAYTEIFEVVKRDKLGKFVTAYLTSTKASVNLP